MSPQYVDFFYMNTFLWIIRENYKKKHVFCAIKPKDIKGCFTLRRNRNSNEGSQSISYKSYL